MTLSRLFAVFVFALLATAPIASPTHAQIGPVFTISNGIAKGTGGFHYDRKQLTLDGMLGARTKNGTGISALLGVYGGAAWGGIGGEPDMVCDYDAASSQPPKCRQEFPNFQYIGLAIGGEARKKYVGLALTGGPGAFRSEYLAKSSTILGILGKADVNFYVGEHFQWVVSGSTRHVANYRGSGLFVNAFSIGIRVQ